MSYSTCICTFAPDWPFFPGKPTSPGSPLKRLKKLTYKYLLWDKYKKSASLERLTFTCSTRETRTNVGKVGVQILTLYRTLVNNIIAQFMLSPASFQKKVKKTSLLQVINFLQVVS